MIEGFKKLYSGEKAFSRQLALFSVCGIVGLFNAYISFDKLSFAEVTFMQKCAFEVLWILFAFFLTGYETLFLHERHIPEIDMRSLNLVLSKTLFFVFLISLPLGLTAMFLPQYTGVAFFIELCLAVPLTMLQGGFSYNFQDSDAGMLFAKFGVKEYFVLVFKRLLMIMFAYFSTYFLVFLIFFIAGIVITLMYSGDVNSIGLLISSQQTVIAKLSNFIAGILLIYFLTIGTLVWDYELIKTYEREEL